MPPPKRQRLDLLLVERGLCPSREQARALVLAGAVRVDDQKIVRPARAFGPEARIAVTERPRYVSRGGFKLEAALDAFPVPVPDVVALDVGASTGGFTDCLLQRGARRVYAVDVGRGQIAWRLRQDPRVILREGVNARRLEREDFPEPVDLATIDVSFISLRLVLPAVGSVLRPGATVIALVKPQFEAGRREVGRGGVVRDPAVRERVVRDICSFIEQELGWSKIGEIESPLPGPAGNREVLVVARVP